MGGLTHTVSGSIATVRSPAVAPIESLKVHFSPIQEGSGDPSPSNVRPITGWTGVTGYKGGKNLFDKNNAPIIESRIASGKVDNTTGYDQSKITYIKCKPSTTYTVKKMQTTRGSVAYVETDLPPALGDTVIGNTTLQNLTTATITTSANAKWLLVYLYNRNYDVVTLSDMLDSLQIEIGSNVTEYESYLGETIPVTFPAVGKNKFNFDEDNISLETTTSNLSRAVYHTGIRGCTLTLSAYKKDPNIQSEYLINYGTYSYSTKLATILGPFITNTGTENAIHQTVSDDEELIISFTSGSTTLLSSNLQKYNIQLELGSTATTYESYNPDNTVYGGYVDLATGNIVATYAKAILDGSIDEPWGVNTYPDQGINRFVLNKTFFTYPTKNGTNNVFINYCIARNHQLPWRGFIGSTGNALFYAPDDEIVDKNAWCAYLSEHNLEICYEMETPTVVAILTPQELETFKGYSNFWSNAGDVDVTYQVVESSEMTKERQKIFSGNAPAIHTTSGSVANFEMEPGLNRNLKSCKVGFLPVQEGSGDPFPPINQNGSIVVVDNLHNESELSSFKIHFSPIQSGSGDPSPTNIRPITGWTGVTGYKGGKSLLPFLTDPMSTAIDYNGYSGWQSKQYIDKSLKGAKVTYSAYIDATSVASGSGDNCVAIWAQDSNGTYIIAGTRGNVIQPGASGWSKVTLTIPVDTDWIAFGITLKTNGIASNPMVELGTEQTTYEAYSAPTSYPVSWESQGTVYGGYVDLVSGEVVRTHGIVDLGALTWNKDSNRAGVFYAYNSGQYTNNSEVISDRYKSLNDYVSTSDDKYISAYTSYGGGKLFIRDTDYSTVTVSEFATALSGSLAIYELQNPVVVTTLTPTQIALATGKSSYWSNANAVTVETAGNVRPIKGWGKISAYSSDENLSSNISSWNSMQNVNGCWENTNVDTKQYFHCVVQLFNNSTYIKTVSEKAIKVVGANSMEFSVDVDNCTRIVLKHSGSVRDLSLSIPANSTFIQGNYTIGFNVVSINSNIIGGLKISDIIMCQTVNYNICSVTFPVHSKNLLDVSNMTHGAYNIGSIPNILESNTTYTFSVNGDTNKTYRLFAVMEDYNTGVGSGISLNASYINKTSNLSFRTFTTPANIKDYPYLALAGNDSSAGNVPINDIKPQVELGSTATLYEPYDNSIFGGYVDLVTGNVIATYKSVNLGDYTWSKINTLYSTVHNKYFYVGTNGELTSSNTRYVIPSDSFCSAFPFIARQDMYMIDNTRGIAFDNGAIYISWPEVDNFTVSEFKEWVNGYYLVAPLVTPIEYQLTPTQIQALKGTNNILSDANGIIEVKYWSH